jgi:hypothetical protein
MESLGDRSQQRASVERFVRENPGALLYDAEQSVIFDVFSGKSLPLDFGRVAELAERRNAETGRPYLLLVRDDGRQLALADVGLAFEPLTASTGPLPDLPPVVCFRDLAQAEAKLTHYLLDHPAEPATRAHLTLFLFCVAVVDGARAVGFDVSSEERRLERLLAEIEARREGC